MNAHPKTAALIDTIQANPSSYETAHRLIHAANGLLPQFEAGQPVDAKKLRAARVVENWPDVLRCIATMLSGRMQPSHLLKNWQRARGSTTWRSPYGKSGGLNAHCSS